MKRITAGQAIESLIGKYGTDDHYELHEKTGLPINTLSSWVRYPERVLRRASAITLTKILDGEMIARPPTPTETDHEILEKLKAEHEVLKSGHSKIESMIKNLAKGLLSLDHQGRLEKLMQITGEREIRKSVSPRIRRVGT